MFAFLTGSASRFNPVLFLAKSSATWKNAFHTTTKNLSVHSHRFVTLNLSFFFCFLFFFPPLPVTTPRTHGPWNFLQAPSSSTYQIALHFILYCYFPSPFSQKFKYASNTTTANKKHKQGFYGNKLLAFQVLPEGWIFGICTPCTFFQAQHQNWLQGNSTTYWTSSTAPCSLYLVEAILLTSYSAGASLDEIHFLNKSHPKMGQLQAVQEIREVLLLTPVLNFPFYLQ